MKVIKRMFVALIVFIFLTGCSIEMRTTGYKYVEKVSKSTKKKKGEK